VITRIGWAHLEGFGTPEALVAEKMSILEELPDTGWCAVNMDDPNQETFPRRTRCRLVTYGFGEADVSARKVSDEKSMTAFTLKTSHGQERVHLNASGRHFVEDALAAVAGVAPLGIPMELVISGLADWRPVVQRGEVLSPMPGVNFIDDTYNANPLSVQTALSNLARLSQEGITVAVLGEMKELGDYHEEGHLMAGRAAARLGIDYLLPVGSCAELIAKGALEEGMNPSRVKVCPTEEEAVRVLGGLLSTGMWVLFKGSREARMENIMEAFLRRETSSNAGRV
jgi:UDP-N-acetylmuramoyl-tripeptide--D-alanyl-D-alanine ligase